ncbi:acetolactate synthase large subunit [Methanosalsum natronophilum]|uniref:Acetolactate synthase large subunit n=1 Tax=Methanosalsum natronophilum TaxID=768733 RepID=A0A3R7XHT3_9EURY|nr:acetolactate synthase large subunit [Methanosalsum natronophilum]MCS3923167.1 acetolactate synthase-1/2/3 large subunit [Methanosalsum natronophilum]RQD84922.1 MAG: acetolactate synthase large subunit [Methanosalsum natronophilum]
MKASDLFVKCLEEEGVDYIFGIPGEETVDLMHSISRSKIEFIVTRHEQSAAFMANMYGRMTHKPGVCLATLGPGATNLITGVADAHLDRAPMVAITGQGGLDRTHKESHQYIDIVTTFKTITAWNSGILRADFIPEVIAKGFDIAKNVPGAVHIELPEDVAKEDSQKGPILKKSYSHTTHCDEIELENASKLMEEALNPLILVGNGAIRFGASEVLRHFVACSGIPVVTTFMGKGSIPADDEHFIGSMGIPDRDYIMCGLDRADLVICIGYDPVEYSPMHWNFNGEKRIVHIHQNVPDISENYVPDAALIGDIKESLKSLLTYCKVLDEMPQEFKDLRSQMVDELESYKLDDSYPIKPQKILWDIRQSLPRDGILISDVGAHKLWVGRLFPGMDENTVFISNGLASMGFALPAAISASLINPDKKIVAVVGDGGFMMNVQELETAVRLGSNFVVVIFNDSKYGVIAWSEMKKFNEEVGTDFNNPDFVTLAKSFGANAIKVETALDLKKSIEHSLYEGGVWIIDVAVDYSENIKLTKKLNQSSCNV